MDHNTPTWLILAVFACGTLVCLVVFVLLCRIGERIGIPDGEGTVNYGKGCLSKAAFTIAFSIAWGAIWLLDRLIAYFGW